MRQAHWADTRWQAGWAWVHLYSVARVGDVGDDGRRRGGLHNLAHGRGCCRGRHPKQGTSESVCAQAVQRRATWRRHGQRDVRGERRGRSQSDSPSSPWHMSEAFERELERRSAKFVQVPEDETSNELVIAKIASNSSY
jgi:hypothetical protein